ncbi:hypothetical protein H9X85_03360 [Anaerotignum lactatifermentans]|uniref:DUF5050 domain-containing protein n=1 Tax=Anaerotignum lactatifermentans TaxID=160404 RepID=A0ABS2GCN1_9FIRM|nr:hypothetical protein [Anaerotignum lactatifermentans]MBM6828672.1 hypothetical protein [Anaerotignum lactatifermentans]MBM6878805.1 hypothetical protein [Anaerotignum lactatifermentans]MBM6950254.1 hypothetical protein [Anaerotignum lactatifermentans]
MDEEKKELTAAEKEAAAVEEAAGAEEATAAEAVTEEETTMEEAEAAAEETAAAEAEPVTEEAAKAEQEPSQNVPAEETAVQAPASKGGANILGILIGLVFFVAVLAACWKVAGDAGRIFDTGVVFAKDNNLYVYDLENEPYLAAEGISDGGQYNYYFTAWGAAFSEDGSVLYYPNAIGENGRFDLYYRQTSGSEGTLISSDVMDYQISADGAKAIYMKAAEGESQLCYFDGTAETVVETGVTMDTDSYAISKDGSYIVYLKQGESGVDLYVKGTAEGAEAQLLTGSAAIFSMAAETNTLYYVAAQGDTYSAYAYTNGEEPQCIMENVTYMEVMGNGKDVLLMAQDQEKVIPYTDFIEDDMAVEDAALTDTEGEAYEAKAARDEIRQAMENGEGIAPIMQDCYIYTNGQITLAAEGVLSAVSVANDHPYAACFTMESNTKVNLSEISSLDEAEFAYYMSLIYGEQKVILVNAGGTVSTLEGTAIDPSDMLLSGDGTAAAYYETDMNTGEVSLKAGKLTGSFDTVVEQAENAGFLGKTSKLGYYKDYENGVGTVGVVGWDMEEKSGVSGVHFSEDSEAIYCIGDINGTTGNGSLYLLESDGETVLDTEVFSFQYKGNGNLVYFKNYDLTTGLGDLYYYNGKESIQLAEGVTAIFM